MCLLSHAYSLYLHSNMFLLFPAAIRSAIRLPLFTFQYVSIISDFATAGVLTELEFTFQYVSIISFAVHCAFCNQFSFTFQYVSIISWFARCNPSGFHNLHSNMFLLFRKCILNRAVFLEYLHSNMFLLFLVFLIQNRHKKKIYIPICFYYFQSLLKDLQKCMTNLHSNMFLLFLFRNLSCPMFRHIYIPICFYYFLVCGTV